MLIINWLFPRAVIDGDVLIILRIVATINTKLVAAPCGR
jgi:hypothetical protein